MMKVKLNLNARNYKEVVSRHPSLPVSSIFWYENTETFKSSPCIVPFLKIQTNVVLRTKLNHLYYPSLPVNRGEHRDGYRKRGMG